MLSKKEREYHRLVEKKYLIYNSLFLNLPYGKVSNVGMLIPILSDFCELNFKKGLSPLQIIDQFFESTTEIKTEEEKVDFFFKVIQYVERQVVLFDSIEDAGFSDVLDKDNTLQLTDYFPDFKRRKETEALAKKLNDFSVRLVFTAHPTQFYPLSVLDIINRLRKYVAKNDLKEIDRTLHQLGLTSFINSEKPTPFQEAKNIIYYLRHVYYNAIGSFYYQLKKKSDDTFIFDNPDLIKIGFWPGGDRDGNPFVTSQTTWKVADELRMTLMKCYYNELKSLQSKLTFRKVEEVLGPLKEGLYKSMFDKDFIVSYTDIKEPIQQALAFIESDYNGLYASEVRQLLTKIEVFKTHFATLDIRQDHSKHLEIFTIIFRENGWVKEDLNELSEDALLDYLLNHTTQIKDEWFEDEVLLETVKNVRQLKAIQARNGEEGCNRYIISNSEDIISVLFVYQLFKWTGSTDEHFSFDIVPLFETMIGMENAEATMIKLFTMPFYREHVKRRGDKQTIMLGFSDGTKDGGYLKANWSIFKTKETLTRVCGDFDIKALFFDGRGGPPARGGGKTHQFYASQGPTIANEEIQLTIQGQTITSTYGTEEQFNYNCAQMVTSGLSSLISGGEESISVKNRALIHEMAELSFDKYNALKNHPDFIPYLENMSTLKYYSNAKIGSRPGKRGKKKELTLDDLRAISFVGSWSQLKQNVPGYFGIGSALKHFKEQGKLEEVKQLFKEVPYFKALMMNSMMSLTKTYFPLTFYMKDHPRFSDFWIILEEEYQASKAMLLEISGYEVLMEEEPISRRSIKIREKIVLPLLTIQQYALQKIAEGTEKEEVYKKIVTRSLYGNINASRNSA